MRVVGCQPKAGDLMGTRSRGVTGELGCHSKAIENHVVRAGALVCHRISKKEAAGRQILIYSARLFARLKMRTLLPMHGREHWHRHASMR